MQYSLRKHLDSYITLVRMLILLCVLGGLGGQLSRVYAYNLIKNFDNKDKVYLAFTQDLSINADPSSISPNNSSPNNTEPSTQTNLDFKIYEYQLKKGDTLLSISKKTRTSISALISLNKTNRAGQLNTGDYILLPTKKGIFMNVNPSNDLEFLINKRISPQIRYQKPHFIHASYAKLNDLFYFIPEITLTKVEYLLWSNTNFSPPVLQGKISSYYGMRVSPISGYKIFHKGIDISLKSGSEIFASKAGYVESDGFDKVYGYFLIINHNKGFKTLYGHLLDTKIKVGDTVYEGQHIAYMGSTGASTGPHIHFEIHKDGKPIDPLSILNLEEE